ncbi:MAG: N-acetylneuraminate lyase [Planctomycetes bacterium]|nr:N-acetylneuraminate lyase [Planctomycetota bacterium]
MSPALPDSAKSRFFGLTAAVHTPFDSHGAIDSGQVAPLAAHLASTGVTSVFVAGTTGEGLSLTDDERRALTTAWAEAGRVYKLPVVIHVGGNSLESARQLAAQASAEGVEAFAMLSPHFFKPATVDHLVDACARVAEAAPDLPFYYYDIPALTGVSFPMLAWLERAADCIPNLAGIKYTNPDLAGMLECLAYAEGRFDILYGNDESLLAGLSLGCVGAVGSSYGFAAPLYHRLLDAFVAGDLDSARMWQLRSAQMIRTIAAYGYPAAAKATMELVGIPVGGVRAPLGDLDRDARARLRGDLDALGFFAWIRSS